MREELQKLDQNLPPQQKEMLLEEAKKTFDIGRTIGGKISDLIDDIFE